MFEECALHGCSGCVGAVKEHMADVGVVQACTSERHTAQVHVRLLGPDGPTAQVGIRKIDGRRAWVGIVPLQSLQSIGEGVRARFGRPALANVLKAGECLPLVGVGESVDEFGEERVGLVAGLGDVPGRQRIVIGIRCQGVGESPCEEVLQQGGVGESEVIPTARQERRRTEVLLPLVGHSALVVEFHLRVGLEELEHPRLHPAGRPCPGTGVPNLPGQVGHELDLVLGNETVLPVIAAQPLVDETLVKVD